MNVARPSSPWVTYHAPDKTYNGYTLLTPKGGSVAWLVDMEGRFVHCWEMPLRPGDYGILLPNGNLLYAGKIIPGPLDSFGGSGGVLLEVDWDGNIVWKYEDSYMHHDFCRMDNGNTMVLRWVQIPDEIATKVRGGLPGTEHQGVMWNDSFQEVTPAGEVVWEWLGYEHLDPEIDIICPLCPRNEWTHANACFILPDGDILTTFRRTDNIAIIDKSTGDIKWRWGAGELAHPHNPTLLDSGNILVFDNGDHRRKGTSDYSRVVEVNPKTEKIEWEYQAHPRQLFHALIISGCQRLPNGNTLICEGTKGRLFEVTPDKEMVWEFINPFYFKDMEAAFLGWSNVIFRAYRYSPDHPALKGKSLDPARVELTLRKSPLPKGKAAQERLKHLGYR